MSSQTAQAFGDRNIIVQASGSGNTINIDGFAHLTLISPLRNKVRAPVKDLDLLDPGVRAVSLIGRNADLRTLRNWLETNRAISVRAVTGAGGSGKTRLALELMFEAAARATDPWDAGFLTHREARRFSAAQNLATWGWQRDTLVVIDYAASFAPELSVILEELSQSVADPDVPRLRVLLLERHANAESGWYRSLVPGSHGGAAVKDLFAPWEPVQIQPVRNSSERFEILRRTIELAAPLEHQGSRRSPPVLPALDNEFAQRLSDPKWADPLMPMMAALAAFETGVARALSLSRTDIALRLAEREAARIRLFASNQERHAGTFLVHLAAVTTLCGGLSRNQANQVAAEESSELGLQYPNGNGAAVIDLHRAIPALDDGLEPIRPDLVGEAFLLQAWRSGVSPQVFARALGRAKTNVISVVIRTAQDFAGPGEQRPLQWLNWFIELDDGSLLNAINDALPLETLSLRDFAFSVISALMAKSGDEDRARLLVYLSLRQSGLGQRERALASIEEAVTLYRDLAAVNPDAFRPDLAASLSNLSNRQSELGKREQALASIEEAVTLCRDLAAGHPEAFRPNVALSLNNLSICQSALGQREQALALIEEAVALYRNLTSTRPEAFRPDLALSLNNLSNRQSDLGQREQALASIEEAVALRRDLAAARPDVFRPNLAHSLCLLGRCCRSLGDFDRAVRASREGLDTLRNHFQRFPGVFSDLAKALISNYRSYSERLGQEPDQGILEPFLSYFNHMNASENLP